MLEEYLCLGGTEVANNQRTYGYATTSGCPVGWFRCEPCESIRAATNDWIFPIYRTIEVARNRVQNPSAELSTNTWIAGGFASALVRDTTKAKYGIASFKVTSNSATTDGYMMTNSANRLAVTGGETVDMVASVWVPTPQAGMKLLIFEYSAAGSLLSPTLETPPLAAAAGEWVDLGGAFTLKSNAASVRIGVSAPASIGLGTDWWVDGVAMGTGVTSYFDGDTPDPTDVDEISWVGAPNESASVWNRLVLDTPGHVDANPYEATYISDAPWYDADVEASSRFYGAFLITVENLNSSTRTATVTEGILDGGVVGLTRHATREMRVRALLVADGDDALEYGLAWLNAALATTDCQTHGSACGAVDMQFFAYCPEAPDPSAPPDNDGEDVLDAEIRAPRYIHNVTVISGPLVEQKIKSNNERHVGYIVEWTMVAGTPWVFSTTTEIGVSPSVPSVIQDEPFNLMPYPSAELASGTVVVQTNYVTNPSFETNVADWSVAGDAPIPASGTVVASRSTDVSASGVASLRTRFTATAGGAGGTIYALHTANIPAGTGRRVSISLWLFAAVASGTAVLGNRMMAVVFLDAANTAVGTTTVGPAVVSGGVLSMTSVAVPDTATKVRLVPYVIPTSWSTGAIIDLYVDAVAVTIP